MLNRPWRAASCSAWVRRPSKKTSTASTSRKTAPLERRFQTVIVDPPTVDETIEILKGLRKRYEEHHG